MADIEPISRLKELWLNKPISERQNYLDVLAFSSWVKHNEPWLFHGMTSDPYQQLKSILRDCIPDKR